MSFFTVKLISNMLGLCDRVDSLPQLKTAFICFIDCDLTLPVSNTCDASESSVILSVMVDCHFLGSCILPDA